MMLQKEVMTTQTNITYCIRAGCINGCLSFVSGFLASQNHSVASERI